MMYREHAVQAFVSISVVAGFREASISAFQIVTTPIAGKFSPVHGKNSGTPSGTECSPFAASKIRSDAVSSVPAHQSIFVFLRNTETLYLKVLTQFRTENRFTLFRELP